MMQGWRTGTGTRLLPWKLYCWCLALSSYVVPIALGDDLPKDSEWTGYE